MFNWFKKQTTEIIVPECIATLEQYDDTPAASNDYSYENSIWNSLAESGVTVTPQTAINFVTAYACTRAIAETMASLPFPVYRRASKGGKERDDEHPVYQCLNVSPDGRLDAFAWREAQTAHLLQWGNAYNEIETFRNGQINLHILHPSLVTPYFDNKGNVWYKVYGQNGNNSDVPAWKMLHFAMLGNGLRGYSPIELCRDALGLGISMQSYNNKFFANGASTSGILSHPGKLDPSAIDAIKKRFTENHAGKNAHQISVVQEGITYTPISISPEAAQLLASRVYQTQEICRIYRIDPSIIGEHSNSNWNNVEQQSLNFVQHCIRPFARRLESEINRKLFNSKEGCFAEHKLEGLLRGDIATRYQSYNTGILAGFLNRNECREIENLNPFDGGDDFLQPLNMVAIGNEEPTDADDGSDDPSGVGQAPPQGNDPVPAVNIDQGQNNLVSASLVAVQDAIDRMVRRECETIKSMAKQPKGFVGAVDLFYQKHEQMCSKAIEPSLTVWSIASLKPAPNIAGDMARSGLDELLNLAGESTAEQLTEAVEAWATTRLKLGKQIIMELQNDN